MDSILNRNYYIYLSMEQVHFKKGHEKVMELVKTFIFNPKINKHFDLFMTNNTVQKKKIVAYNGCIFLNKILY